MMGIERAVVEEIEIRRLPMAKIEGNRGPAIKHDLGRELHQFIPTDVPPKKRAAVNNSWVNSIR
jgi:hypothetical protein